MYVTRRLSEILKSPDLVSERPKEPNSGFLVIQDEESETYSCFGMCKNRSLKQLPFPQDKELTVKYTTHTGQSSYVSLNPVFLIPALNQPLSSNRYFAIEPHGKHIGKAFTCSKEEDMTTCCFCRCVKDVKKRPLDLDNIYQEFEIVPYEALCSMKGQYFAKSVAPADGFPPLFLRRKGWNIYTKTPDTFKLEDAKGLDLALRARHPELNATSPLVVGKWYCPFMFVKEGTLREQVKKAMYYEMTLEQRWEQIFSFRKDVSNNNENSVVIDALVETEEVFVSGNKCSWSEKIMADRVIWFKAGEVSVGLRDEIVKRMKWEQKKVGWIDGEESQVKINKVEEFNKSWEWNELKCYILVERFNLKRMDGSLVMSYEFKHCNQLRIKWE